MSEQEKEITNDYLDARVEERINELLELVETKFFAPGDHYGLEQFLDDPGEWASLSDTDRENLLESIRKKFGVNLSNYSEEKIIRRYREEGVPGEPSGNGAEVEVLDTNNSLLEIHVMQYFNPSLGTRYDLVAKK